MGSNRRSSSEKTSAAELRSKLRRVVCGHEQMKNAFHLLKSQIEIGLLEAEDVFASLAIPLMKLVGLKTMEMANEGRFTTFIVQTNTDSLYQSFGTGGVGSGSSDRNRHSVMEEIYAAKAAMAGKLVMENQKQQLIQLVRILKQIEAQINTRQNHMLETLNHRRISLHKFFQRAIAYLSTVDLVDHHAFQIAVLKLLQATFSEVGAVLGSVETDVEDLVQDLAEQMCDPMVDYVEGVKADLSNGVCVGLLGVVKEMERAARELRVELETARNKATVAEASRVEALRRLHEAEDRVSKLKEYLNFLPKPNKACSKVTQHFAPHKVKFLGMEKAQANDEKLLWEVLEKKRKYQTPESPLGPRELLIPFESNNKRPKTTMVKSSVTRRYSLRARTPRLDALIPLGSSPSVTIQQVVSLKQISPKMHA